MGAPVGADGVSEELPLTSELRQALDLKPTESVRLRHAGALTILLERSGAANTPTLAPGCELTLTADVQAFALADILNWVNSGGKSGLLFFSHDIQVRAMAQYFFYVFVTSRRRSDNKCSSAHIASSV